MLRLRVHRPPGWPKLHSTQLIHSWLRD
uniref:Uncharacterized protein n=1 Tax=Arundo donax TaxID=35708 RepID=A0A0A9FMH5_ARUDO